MFLLKEDIASARKEIESTYDCLCDIVEYQAVKNSINKRTEHQEVKVLEKQACRISYKTIANTNQSEQENTTTQIVKLFIAPEVKIKPGSKIVITKEDWLKEYKNSGEPAIYDTHQEIVLEIWKGWA